MPPTSSNRTCSSASASQTTQSGGVGVSSTRSGRQTAVQVEIKNADRHKVGVCRADGIGQLVQVRHHLMIDPAVSKDLAEPRAPFDRETEFILAHVNEQLSHGTEEPSRQP